jgi:3-oxoacyl-[acyl-carrier-protein] synthase II
VSALIAGSAIRTCFGNADATFSALLQGKSGIGALRYFHADRLNVTRGYHILEEGDETWFRASRWLAVCVAEALAQSGVELRGRNVLALVGSGLRELRAVERRAGNCDDARMPPLDLPTERLHFAAAVHEAAPQIDDVITISNACAAGGYVLATAQDLIEGGEADVVVIAGTDAMTESMLAMIGRVADFPTDQVRPFDTGRNGVLLGEGAASLVMVPEGTTPCAQVRVLSTGLSCDAHHETAPDQQGVRRAMLDALVRANRSPADVDLVVAHGTGTRLNDPTEAGAIRDVLAQEGPGPLVTAVKGAVGHTSGASALVSVGMAMQCLELGIVPPIVGLEKLLGEGEGLRFVAGRALEAPLRLAQVNAFGFGGVNAVSLLEKAS